MARLRPASYRPIALLNQDYKIFTAIIANRLSKIILNYIGSEQTGFISHRTIADNIYKTLNIIRFSCFKTTKSLILSLDLEKVFDSMEFQYIKTLLFKINFGECFLNLSAVI